MEARGNQKSTNVDGGSLQEVEKGGGEREEKMLRITPRNWY
jgi:hypothetical protein